MSIRTRFLTTLLTLSLIVTAAVVLLRPSSKAQSKTEEHAQSPTERTVANKVPDLVPLKIEFKKEKEALVKSLSNEKWLEDFSVEITNTSNKPIYYFDLWLVLPETLGDNGDPINFPIVYGRTDFIVFDTRPSKEDQPIKPRETRSFQIPKEFAGLWNQLRVTRNYSQPQKLEIQFVHLSFGDGTGFDGAGRPYPYEKASNNMSGRARNSVSILFTHTNTGYWAG